MISEAIWYNPLAGADVHPGARPQAVTLRDGRQVPVRPIRPADAPALQRFHSRLSDQTVYLRFFEQMPQLSDELAQRLTHLDTPGRVALIALDPAQPAEIIAVVRYERAAGTDRAEYAATVADAWQHQGLGLALTRALIAEARAEGIRYFEALVLADNQAMRGLFQHLGLPTQTAWESGPVLRITIDLGGESPPPPAAPQPAH
jgi:RimJ/RimL family protein N-acetyltransferase